MLAVRRSTAIQFLFLLMLSLCLLTCAGKAGGFSTAGTLANPSPIDSGGKTSSVPFVNVRSLPLPEKIVFELPLEEEMVSRLIEAVFERLELNSLDPRGISFRDLAIGFAYLFENIRTHEFSNEDAYNPSVRIYPYEEGLRIELVGRGDSPLPERLTAKPWFSAEDPPWLGEAPKDSLSPRSRQRNGIVNMFEAFGNADRNGTILVSWNKHPSALKNLIAIHIPLRRAESLQIRQTLADGRFMTSLAPEALVNNEHFKTWSWEELTTREYPIFHVPNHEVSDQQDAVIQGAL